VAPPHCSRISNANRGLGHDRSQNTFDPSRTRNPHLCCSDGCGTCRFLLWSRVDGAIQMAGARICPAQFELIPGGFCLKPANGDVAMAEPRTAAPVYTNANCSKGYEILANNLCMNDKTGDVVFANTNSSIQTAAK
jgi:hypothetical protein